MWNTYIELLWLFVLCCNATKTYGVEIASEILQIVLLAV